MLGPYYYFTDLEHALRQEGANGIVRFAVFTGRKKCIHNLPHSGDQEQQEDNCSSLDRVEMATKRLLDHEGLWTKEYDSVYLGEMEMDDGTRLTNKPVMVVKEYSQQVPLSYHLVNQPRTGIV